MKEKIKAYKARKKIKRIAEEKKNLAPSSGNMGKAISDNIAGLEEEERMAVVAF